MKYYLLKQITQYIEKFHTIRYIKRVANNTIKIEFNNKETLYFEIAKGNGKVYKKDSKDIIKKDFNAPFDVVLAKRFNNSKIFKVFLRNDDKIINIEVQSKSSYKLQKTILQIEFTGKHTNIIIIDENDIVLEALRHIDEWTSVRVVKVGNKLIELKKPEFKYKTDVCKNIEQYLYNIHKDQEEKEFKNLQTQKIDSVNKQKNKIEKILNSLEDTEKLKSKSEELSLKASNILNEIYKYEGYKKQKRIEESNNLFRDSKKYKQKAKNQYIEQLNLSQKLEFYNRLILTLKKSITIEELEFYLPKKDKNQTKTKKANPYQSFFIDGFKIMLGRDERENIYLLQNSKASDFWFHLQGQVSSHLIVSNTKKTLPEHIIEECAKLVVNFSSDNNGTFRVDYTQRRNVKIQSRANVLYTPYNTITIKT
jgi:predicted ribosome quality control (RQC) complex YloA/Tae2 family protein